MVSLPVKASRLPPMESISRAMCSAERERVPLKSMCSTKWEMPLVSAGSHREPDLIHTPIATERRCSMRSVRTISPLGNTVRRRLRSLFMVFCFRLCGCQPTHKRDRTLLLDSWILEKEQHKRVRLPGLHGREEMLYAGPSRERAFRSTSSIRHQPPGRGKRGETLRFGRRGAECADGPAGRAG